MMRPHNAAGRHAGQLVLLSELRGERVAIRAGRATVDVTLMVASLAGSGLPAPVIGPSTANMPRSWSMTIRQNGGRGSASGMGEV